MDVVFLLTSLNEDFNLRRMERYLTLAWESGAQPVVVLTKTDLSDTVDLRVLEVEAIAFGVPVHAISSITGDGLDVIRSYLAPGRTIALLGSSGVGKSTLVNTLAGEELLAVKEIREDGEGRHTTTHRQLVLLPGGRARARHAGNARAAVVGILGRARRDLLGHRGARRALSLQRLRAR